MLPLQTKPLWALCRWVDRSKTHKNTKKNKQKKERVFREKKSACGRTAGRNKACKIQNFKKYSKYSKKYSKYSNFFPKILQKYKNITKNPKNQKELTLKTFNLIIYVFSPIWRPKVPPFMSGAPRGIKAHAWFYWYREYLNPATRTWRLGLQYKWGVWLNT